MKLIQKRINGFFIQGPGKTILAEISFKRPEHGKIVIDHTFVDESLSGQGIGKQLVREIIELGRAEGCIIEATCSFAKRILEKTVFD